MKTLVGYYGGSADQPKRGQAIRVVNGPYANFVGIVDSVNHAKGKVNVRLSVAGREMPIELDFFQLEKFD